MTGSLDSSIWNFNPSGKSIVKSRYLFFGTGKACLFYGKESEDKPAILVCTKISERHIEAARRF